jgi:mRNA interferase HigB
MHGITPLRLKQLWSQPNQGDAEAPLRQWLRVVRLATWRTPSDVKASFGNASILHDSVVVFNIGGNKYRLVTVILYRAGQVLIRGVYTHAEYDQLDLG